MNYSKVDSILYAEDEFDIREQLSSFLQRFCVKLYKAKDGNEGLELYKTHKPDIVISDIKMPGKNGIDMAKEIREIDSEQHIVFTTAHSENNFFIEAIDMQVDGYILKPLDLKLLKNKLIKIMQSIHLESNFKEQQELLQNISLLQDNMLIVFKNNQPIFTNANFSNFFEDSQYADISALGSTFIKHGDFFVPDDKNNWYKEIKDLSDEKRVVAIFDKDTFTSRSFLLNIKYIKEQDHLVIIFSEITNLTIERIKFEKKAYIDELTNIANRAKFNEELKSEMLRYKREKFSFCLMMFDIDHFKKFNDTYGHQKGDEILKELSELVQNRTRVTDLFARWGGEEFIVILKNATLKNAKNVANTLKNEIENKEFKDKLGLTCSFGTTQITNNDTIDTLLKRVDEALYLAKANGRNIVMEL